MLDAGCGSGRNLVYLLQNGYDVYAVDASGDAVRAVRDLAAKLAPHLSADHFRAEPIEAMTFGDDFFDVVISSAVLHFAHDDESFRAMLRGSCRVLKPGGLFFCRLASTIGIEDLVQSQAGRRSLLPDGSTRYLVDEAMLMDLTRELGGRLLDPLKTTVVQGQRAMTTWAVEKMVPLKNG